MNGKKYFLGMNYIKAKFIDEAESVMQLNIDKKTFSGKQTILIAVVVGFLLMLAGYGAGIYKAYDLFFCGLC